MQQIIQQLTHERNELRHQLTAVEKCLHVLGARNGNKRVFSPAAIKRISMAQKKRWEKFRAAKKAA